VTPTGTAPGGGPLFGTTSYVLPDALLPNVRLLSPLVDDIELVLFESEESNLPSPAEVREMARLAEAAGSGFTVHLPLDSGVGEPEPVRRRQGQDICLRVMELTQPLSPHAFVLHPELPVAYAPAPGTRPPRLDALPDGERRRWLDALDDSAARLLAAADGRPLAAENLQYPYAWLDPLLARHPLAVTADIGHLMLRGDDVTGHLNRYGERLAVVHLHALRDGDDHQALDAFPRGDLSALFAHPALAARSLVVTLEVFGSRATAASLEVLSRILEGAVAARMARAADAVREAAREAARRHRADGL
jgi:sugar phosphate isomerase/epimerase